MSIDANPYESPQTRSEAVIPAAGEDGSRCFRAGFVPLWLCFMLVAAILGPLTFIPLVVFTQSSATRRIVEVSVLLAGLLLGGTVVLFCCWQWNLFPVYVSDLGVRCPNTWGMYQFVVRREVTNVKPIKLLGLRYFRVYGNARRRPVWLPCFMAKPKLFWPYLLSLLERDSPLAKAIREAGLAE